MSIIYPKGQKPLKYWDQRKTTSDYGQRVDPFTKQIRFHDGIDKASNNEEVKPWNTGVVAFTVPSWGELYIDHKDKRVGDQWIRTIYAHNKDLKVRGGMVVKPDTVLAFTDNMGKSTGAHLHFGAVLMPSRKSIDPNLLLEDDMIKLTAEEINKIKELRPDVVKAGADIEKWFNEYGAKEFIRQYYGKTLAYDKCQELSKKKDEDFIAKVQAEVSKATKTIQEKLSICRNDKAKVEEALVKCNKRSPKSIWEKIRDWFN